jgi:hypothetical protein
MELHKWNDVATHVAPLDMIFFHGGELISKIIHIMEKLTVGSGEYTHVGCVVNDELLPDCGLEHGQWYVWESTFSSKLFKSGDIGVLGTEGGHFGPQLRKLDKVVPAYLSKQGTAMALGKLRGNPWLDVSMRPRIIKKFRKVFNEYNDIRYDYNPISLLGSIIKPLRTHNDKLFCSELVAVVYVKLGILPADVDPAGVIPMDFFGIDADKVVPCCVGKLYEISV